MSSRSFFQRKKVRLSNVFPNISKKDDFILDQVKPLNKATKLDLTFFDNVKYKFLASNTKARACITTEKLKKFLPNNILVIPVKSVLFELAKILNQIYLKADVDYPDNSLNKPNQKKYKSVIFGKNTLIGKNVKIGKNTIIGSNTIIEHQVIIGSNCVIGSNTVIKNSIIGDNVVIQDGNKIGQKGFGFIPIKGKNIKFPHIGKVIIANDVEIASGVR